MSGVILNDQNFSQEVLNSNQPVLVDFFADWCGPCKMQGPIIEELAGEMTGRAKIGKLNVDSAPETAGKYSVMSIPTIIIFSGGAVKKTLVGLQGKEALKAELEKLI